MTTQAGKGPSPRPYSVRKHDEGYDAIHWPSDDDEQAFQDGLYDEMKQRIVSGDDDATDRRSFARGRGRR